MLLFWCSLVHNKTWFGHSREILLCFSLWYWHIITSNKERGNLNTTWSPTMRSGWQCYYEFISGCFCCFEAAQFTAGHINLLSSIVLVLFWSLSVTQRYALGTLPSLPLSDRERTGLAYIDMVSVEWKRVPPGTLFFIIIIILCFFPCLWTHWWAISRAGMFPSCCRLTRLSSSSLWLQTQRERWLSLFMMSGRETLYRKENTKFLQQWF